MAGGLEGRSGRGVTKNDNHAHLASFERTALILSSEGGEGEEGTTITQRASPVDITIP